MNPSNVNRLSLREWMSPVLIIVMGMFATTSLLLHMWLNTMETSGNLLQMSSDWQRQMYTNHDTALLRQGNEQQVRQEFENQYPPQDTGRIRSFVHAQRVGNVATQPGMPYDIFTCPDDPPLNYPMAWNILDLLKHWNPNNTTLPQQLYQGLCVFDYDLDFDKALRYRHAELPFVLVNQPDLLQTSERWTRNESYLLNLLGEEAERVEHSTNNHFMYWKLRRSAENTGWKPPTDESKLTYSEWLDKAKQMQLSSNINQVSQEHWYFRINGVWKKIHSFLYDELPIFRPERSFFMVDPRQHRGINCRFGMKGIIAEAHYDSSRNFVVLLGGQRRYILAHPDQCSNLELYPMDHPSGRHSSVDWTTSTERLREEHELFAQTQANEVVLQAGDTLYLPTSWFHFIVSLDINYQCNARSGVTNHYREPIANCGFQM